MVQAAQTKGLSSITAVVLAGGLGSRLRSLVADRPKVLAEIRGRPFLAYIFDQLRGVDIQNVVLCTGYQAEMVRARFGGFYDKLRLVYSEESSPMGTAGALRLALPLFESDPVLVMNGDSFCDVNLSSFWDWHCRHGASASMVLVAATDVKQSGSVEVSSSGKIVSFREKNATGYPGWINAGIYLIAAAMIKTIPEEGAVSLERVMFPAWIRKGIYGYQSDGKFLDIGTPGNYTAADKFFSPENVEI